MVVHAILFVVLPLVVAWFAGVTACLPPCSPMLTENRRSRVVRGNNSAVSSPQSGNAAREAAD
jgi:hypothetical protein